MKSAAINRVKNSFFGALAGDCIGSIYEDAGFKGLLFSDEVSAKNFSGEVVQLVKDFPTSRSTPIKYTDDTAMARSLAKTLIDCAQFDALHLSKLLCDTYFSEPDRGYGNSIPIVFRQWRDNNYSDLYGPAKCQFGGTGSRGNGAAIRVFPVALFYHVDLGDLIRTAKEQSLLTHTHPDAIMGAILQAVAVYLALNCDDSNPLKLRNFVFALLEVMNFQCTDIYGEDGINPYIESIQQFETLLNNGASNFVVANKLGNGVVALRSVPAAIFAFLKIALTGEQSDLQGIDNGVLRTVAYAISLGGDTDSIGSMAGAIAGAFYDQTIIKTYASLLEGYNDYEQFASMISAKAQVSP